jgi:hypothetical protein
MVMEGGKEKVERERDRSTLHMYENVIMKPR